MLEKFVSWLVLSSKDPSKISLAVKGHILLAIPTILYWIGVTCKIGAACIDVDAGTLETFATITGDLILFGLLLLGTIASLYGWVRKIYLTIVGRNHLG